MSIKHHEAIKYALSHFNLSYLQEHNILFGGGTRIALELNEFRTSVDIDFLCPDKNSYRAVRSQARSNSLGDLISSPIRLKREVRTDRDAVRTIIEAKECLIKVEFVAFDNYNLKAADDVKWGVPIIDVNSCYITKILANADRFREPVKKDIVDLIKMFESWGEPSDYVWAEVDSHYGKVGFDSLYQALDDILTKPRHLEKTFEVCEICDEEASNILTFAQNWKELIDDNSWQIKP